MSEELCYLSAVDALDMFRRRDLSPVEMMQAIFDRIERVESRIGAFTYTYYEEAMDRARQAEAAYLNGGARPLEGVPVAIKDDTSVEGKITTIGSTLFKDNVADHTDPLPERLLEAGAIVHAKSRCSEFVMSSSTYSRLWGTTHNPWNIDYSSGGSSGGSGAALAAGTTLLASGTDMAGSIRIPASQCGVVGFKPPYGRVPQPPPWNLDPYSHHGPLARTVGDTILFENTIAGPHPLDISTVKPGLLLPSEYGPVKGMRAAYSLDMGHKEVDEDIRRNTTTALEVLADLGMEVEEVDLGWTDRCRETALVHIMFFSGRMLKARMGDALSSADLTPYVRTLLEASEQITAADVFDARDHEIEMYRQLSRVFTKHDLLVCPTTAIASFAPDFDYATDDLVINGNKVDPILGETMTYFFNTLSRCPVITVPSGKDRNNIPTGIQFIAPPYEDERVFRAAIGYEQASQPFFGKSDLPRL